jgi:hypothetical protein
MTYVDYVRDREVADVHVLVTRQNTGAGGEAHTFDLIGRGPFQGMDYSTVYTTTRAPRTRRSGRDSSARSRRRSSPTCCRPPWAAPDRRGGAGGGRRPDRRSRGRSLEPLDLRDLRRRQRGLRVPAGVLQHALRRVRQPGHGGLEDPAPALLQLQLRPLRARRRDHHEHVPTDGFTSYVVRSISPHWSVGAFGDVFTSTFDNVDMRYRLMPAIEYSLYPYREATRRQLTSPTGRRLPHRLPGHDDLRRDGAAPAGAHAERRLRGDAALGARSTSA